MNQVRIVENKISFDFDGTLDNDFDGTLNPQKEEIQNICKQLIEQGKDVCIITKRYHPQTDSSSGWYGRWISRRCSHAGCG